MLKTEYKVKRPLPQMSEGTLWTLVAQERTPDGFVLLQSAMSRIKVPASWIHDSDWFEQVIDDTELFTDEFYKWLEIHGVVERYGDSDTYTIDMNKLKAGIMQLEYEQFQS